MVKKVEKVPFLILVNKKKVKAYLDKDKWREASEGWHFDHDLGAVKVKYPNIIGNYRVVINFDQFVVFSEEYD